MVDSLRKRTTSSAASTSVLEAGNYNQKKRESKYMLLTQANMVMW
ncbi:unnamed protein product [Linum tenue]|uniref:Uncharacterized protein n=1 Tax=Linum tenue TaxID=586396 RepID=A0AAV0IAU5_9ROSI|nr:unnamed protein product [Linum tenue]